MPRNRMPRRNTVRLGLISKKGHLLGAYSIISLKNRGYEKRGGWEKQDVPSPCRNHSLGCDFLYDRNFYSKMTDCRGISF